MTGKHDKLRSLFLTALMVMSVFAMTVGFAGSAAATNSELVIDSAIEYESGDDDPGSEIIVETNMDIVGDTVVIDSLSEVSQTDSIEEVDADDNVYRIHLSEDVTPNQELDISITDGDDTTYASYEGVTVTATSIAGGDNPTVYRGEPIAVIDATSSDGFTVSGGGETISANAGDDGVARLQTSNLDTGAEYTITGLDDSDGEPTAEFNVSNLGLAVSADDVNTDASAIEAEVGTNRNGPGIVEVMDGDDRVSATTADFDALDNSTVDLEVPSSAGNYTVVATDNLTGNTAETDITVEEAGTAGVSFSPNVVQEHRGDVATITVDTSNTDDATVVIGSESASYWLHANVTDANDDGQVVLQFNTYAAGTDSTTLTSPDDNAIVDDTEGGDFDAGLGDNTLDAGRYNMNVSSGHEDIGSVTQDAVGTLAIQERATNNLTTMVAPDGTDFANLGPAAVQAGLGSNITMADEIAGDDMAVFQIDASGLGGVFEVSEDNLDDVFGEDDATLNLTIKHTNPGINQGGSHIELSSENTEIVPDAANDTYYVAVDVADAADGNNYNTTLDVDGTLGDTDSNAEVYDTWSKVGEDTSLDMTDDLVVVQPTTNQSVSGTTNLAPGSEISIQVESEDTTSPFLIPMEATVQPDGSFSDMTSEFQNVSMGTNFSVIVERGGDSLLDSPADGRVTEAPGTDTPGTDTPGTDTPGTDTPGTDTPGTDTPGTDTPGTDTPGTDDPSPEETTPAEGPGFGIAVGLIALIGAALLAARRQN